ncbi:MAG: hypothetical protein GY745_10770 [Actinomycetia bacterium]|nr:hypothetical protein [Actinomycetes bacterium]
MEYTIQVQLLGGLDLKAENRSIRLPRGQAKLALSMLLIGAPGTVSFDALADELWGDFWPHDSKNGIQQVVANLRRVMNRAHPNLGTELVRTEPNGYRIDLAAAQIDVRRFDQLYTKARSHYDPRQVLDCVDEALGLWRGKPFGEIDGRHFIRAETARLLEMYQDAFDVRLQALLTLGRAETAVSELQALVLGTPLRERRWELLMLGLYRLGRQPEALQTMQRVRHLLAEFTGLLPGPALRQLEQKILTHDAALLAS